MEKNNPCEAGPGRAGPRVTRAVQLEQDCDGAARGQDSAQGSSLFTPQGNAAQATRPRTCRAGRCGLARVILAPAEAKGEAGSV